jgi:ABC-type dipeptide/oligopeptide/nickel transport system ATPase component
LIAVPKGDTLLKVENLKAYYASKKGLVRAVDDVSFVIHEGECVGLLGESGCGKTSLALAIMGFFERVARYAAATSDSSLRREFDRTSKPQTPDRAGVRGRVCFRGFELTALPEEELVKLRGKELSMIPQGLGHALNPMFSVGMQTGEPV